MTQRNDVSINLVALSDVRSIGFKLNLLQSLDTPCINAYKYSAELTDNTSVHSEVHAVSMSDIIRENRIVNCNRHMWEKIHANVP